MRLWLRTMRRDAGMTELEAAKKAGIAQPFYHNIETGKKNPSVLTAKKIAAIFNFDWTAFFQNTSEQAN